MIHTRAGANIEFFALAVQLDRNDVCRGVDPIRGRAVFSEAPFLEERKIDGDRAVVASMAPAYECAPRRVGPK
jgi:hypothetical protein